MHAHHVGIELDAVSGLVLNRQISILESRPFMHDDFLPEVDVFWPTREPGNSASRKPRAPTQ
jgi:hypothetical protein